MPITIKAPESPRFGRRFLPLGGIRALLEIDSVYAQIVAQSWALDNA